MNQKSALLTSSLLLLVAGCGPALLVHAQEAPPKPGSVVPITNPKPPVAPPPPIEASPMPLHPPKHHKKPASKTKSKRATKTTSQIHPLSVVPITNPKLAFVETPFAQLLNNQTSATTATVTFDFGQAPPKYVAVRITFTSINGGPGFNPNIWNTNATLVNPSKNGNQISSTAPHGKPLPNTVQVQIVATAVETIGIAHN